MRRGGTLFTNSSASAVYQIQAYFVAPLIYIAKLNVANSTPVACHGIEIAVPVGTAIL